MTTFVALLRGINVGGKTLPMATVKNAFAELGHTDVRTYLQSGNVVFTPKGSSAARVASALEQELERRSGLNVSVLLRTAAQMKAIGKAHPYARHAADLGKLHVTFLSATPPKAKVRALAAPAGETGVFTVKGAEVYVHTPGGYGTTKK